MYKLKKGVRLLIRRTSTYLSEKNCTEMNCAAALADNPKNIALFEEFPDDWEKRAAAYAQSLIPKSQRMAQENAEKMADKARAAESKAAESKVKNEAAATTVAETKKEVEATETTALKKSSGKKK